MTDEDLAARMVGENLDALMNVDPRGYGIARILYGGARALAGRPLSLAAAEALAAAVRPGDAVLLLTGFVLLPHKLPEMDGPAGSLSLARAIVRACGATPIVVCPDDCLVAIEASARAAGLHCYRDVQTALALPLSMGVIPFPKNGSEAEGRAAWILDECEPSLAIAVECSGANAQGIYHNAGGEDVSALEAKTDVLWNAARGRGIATVAVGDLGNEVGMRSLAPHIEPFIPRVGREGCRCGCGGGILSATRADLVVTATCSDWGCYGIAAALAYLKRDAGIIPEKGQVADVMCALSAAGVVDSTGSPLPGVDGFDVDMTENVVSLMRDGVRHTMRNLERNKPWFDQVVGRGYFEPDALHKKVS